LKTTAGLKFFFLIGQKWTLKKLKKTRGFLRGLVGTGAPKYFCGLEGSKGRKGRYQVNQGKNFEPTRSFFKAFNFSCADFETLFLEFAQNLHSF